MKKQLVSIIALSSISLLSFSTKSNAEESSSYQSNGLVEFIPNLDPTDPVDPENPDPDNPVKPIDPTDPDGPNEGTQGPLSIDYASSLDFGKNRISNKDQIYYARAQSYQGEQHDTPNFVQISDHRGTNGGWTLKVKQETQLTAIVDTLNKELTGSQITLSDPHVNSNSAENVMSPEAKNPIILKPGEESVVTSAKVGAGAGTWATYWGNVEEVEERDEDNNVNKVNITKAVSLSVPGETPKDAVKYQTKLIWTLTDTPEI